MIILDRFVEVRGLYMLHVCLRTWDVGFEYGKRERGRPAYAEDTKSGLKN